jgi:hypothetical protein
VSDYCYKCGDFIQYEAFCWPCHDSEKKSDDERNVIDAAEVINTTFDRPIRIVIKPIRRDGAEWNWSISVNIGGWQKGETVNVSSMTIVAGIAYGMRMLNGEIEG